MLLNKNLNFCPRPKEFNRSDLNNDINKFCRRIKIRAHFGSNSKEQLPEEQIFAKRNSTWTPSYTDHTVETFIAAIKHDIDNSKTKPLPKDNLTPKEREALSDLSQREDIIITKADKGGATVIMDVHSYITEAERQLKNTAFYQELPMSPTEDHRVKINDAIETFKTQQLLSVKLAEGLRTEKPKTPRFYILPKIHKQGNPGRPVVSSVNCHTSKISAYVDHHVKPLVTKLSSYVKDTTDFLNKIEKVDRVPANTYLVSMDVRSLYTNIPNEEGLEALRHTLEKRRSGSYTAHSTVLLKFMELILTLNNFVFNCVNYLQIKGCAMGTNCAPSYANIFMGRFEETYIYPMISRRCKIYLRYIDDIFLIWTDTKDNFETFIKDLNVKHPSIKFDYEISDKEVNFLDTTVYVDQIGKLQTKLYRKPTDRQNYLHSLSDHQHTLKSSIAYGQALRIKRICSEDSEFLKNCELLKESMTKRGYKPDEIENQIKRAANLLETKDRQTSDRIPFVVTYNRTLPPIARTLHKHWHLLQLNPDINDHFKEPPIMAYRRCRNLKDILGSKIIENNRVVRRPLTPAVGKCTPCMSKTGNLCCKQIANTSSFRSASNGKTFRIFHHVNCKSTFVIYIMECSRCKLQYIGKSEFPMNIRINNHRKDAHRPDGLPASQHFNKAGHDFNEHATFTIIEQLKNTDAPKKEKRNTLERREDLWIIKLQTLKPLGLNQELNRPKETSSLKL